jgi:hypothetical protein
VPPPRLFHAGQKQVDFATDDILLPRRHKILDVSSAASSPPTCQPLVARVRGAVHGFVDISFYGISSTSISDTPTRYPFSIPVSETMT